MPISNKPILIVNADDFGWNKEATNKTLDALAANRITSATAMVHMEDSDRAAELALEAGLPVGLHLNLTDPFTDPATNATRRARQLTVCGQFSKRSLRTRSWSFDPRIRTNVETAISDQLERFEELYGQPPTHVDGHNHVNACPNVALAAPLASIGKIRSGPRTWPSVHTGKAAARALRRALVSRRFLTTRYFLSIADLPSEPDLQERLGLARRTSVEVMAHPGFPHEHRSLMSADWGRLLETLPSDSYRGLV